MIYCTFVNYNNTQLSINCVNSIRGDCKEIRVYIIDNGSREQEVLKLNNWKKPDNVEVMFLQENIGYFPAFNYVYQKIRPQLSDDDFFLIGNNDLEFFDTFFYILKEKDYSKEIYVICPDIINEGENHQNPAIISKYSKLQLLYLDLYHYNYIFAALINLISLFFKFRGKQKSKEGHLCSQYISIGYGACFILTAGYFNRIDKIPDYLFLMNEENALSDIVFKHGGRLYYDCSLKVNHMEHSSVTKIPSRKRYKIEQESYRISKQHFKNSKLFDPQIVEYGK